MIPASRQESAQIWTVLQQGINRRKMEGSNQWQDGYPNFQTVLDDIENGFGYLFYHHDKIIGYAALVYNFEPAYDLIKGQWKNNDDFYVIHRLCIDEEFLGKGLSTKFMLLVEDFVRAKKCFNIKVDTNFDNLAMLHIFEKLSYVYCGEVEFRGSPRKAFQKVLE